MLVNSAGREKGQNGTGICEVSQIWTLSRLNYVLFTRLRGYKGRAWIVFVFWGYFKLSILVLLQVEHRSVLLFSNIILLYFRCDRSSSSSFLNLSLFTFSSYCHQVFIILFLYFFLSLSLPLSLFRLSSIRVLSFLTSLFSHFHAFHHCNKLFLFAFQVYSFPVFCCQ